MRIQIFTDGGSRGNPGPGAAGIQVLELGTKETIYYEEAVFLGKVTNNEAEYRAFLLSLDWLLAQSNKHAFESVEWFLDSKLVVEQLQKHWKIKEARLQTLAEKAWQGLSQLTMPWTIRHVPRVQNAAADALVNQALDAQI